MTLLSIMKKNISYIIESFKQKPDHVGGQSQKVELPGCLETELPSEVYQAMQRGLSKITQYLGDIPLDDYLEAKQNEARQRLFGDR